MSKKNDSWYYNPWVIAVGGATIAGIAVSLICDWLKSKPILSTIFSWLMRIKDIATSFFGYKIPIWIIALAIILIYLISRIKFNISQKALPDYWSYKQDRFYNWIWKWDWDFDSVEKKWYMVNLQPYCPKCNTQFVNKSNHLDIAYECPRCKDYFSSRGLNYGHPPEDKQNVEALIIDNVQKRNY